MLHVLEAARIQNLSRVETTTKRKSCNGSKAKAHFRTYAGQQVWIEEHERCDHVRVYTKH